jgi:hypothetical protein
MDARLIRQRKFSGFSFLTPLSVGAVLGVFVFATWTNAYGLGRWGYLPTVFSFICFVAFASNVVVLGVRGTVRVEAYDYTFIAFLLLTIVSALIHPNHKSINYILAYCYTILILSAVFRNLLINYRFARDAFMYANAIGIGLACIFALMEFYSRFAVGVNIQAFIPRGTVANATYYIFPRSYAFAEEPTYISWHLNTLGILAAWYIWKYAKLPVWCKSLYSAVVILAYITMLSMAAMISLIGGVLACAVSILISGDRLRFFSMMKTRRWILPGATTAAFLVAIGTPLISTPSSLFAPLREYVESSFEIPSNYEMSGPLAVTGLRDGGFFGGARDKLLGKADYSRQEWWKQQIPLVLEKPLTGWGPGYLSSIGSQSSLNLFLFVAVEQGLPAAVVLALGFFLLWLRILRSDMSSRHVFLLAYTAGCIHFLTMTQHYHPAIWLTIASFFMFEAACYRSKLDRVRGGAVAV